MKVFKFGGASLKNAGAIRNMGSIIQRFSGEPLLVVVSAMGKTTNALEAVLEAHQKGKDFPSSLREIQNYHRTITSSLLQQPARADKAIEEILQQLQNQFNSGITGDLLYDQVVSLGEVISSIIVHQHLTEVGVPCAWLDARQYIVTDDSYREGKIQWDETRDRIQPLEAELKKNVILTQGFIGATRAGKTTTLGREGSDFSAAIFAACLGAESVTIWKDVPGVMNADPKRLPAAIVFSELPFREAAEMTYYGASVIHPKTIKPLALRNIPLFVKSFDNPDLPGTKIHECKIDQLPPLIVFKDNQCLISCKVTDYTFVSEEQLGLVFGILSELNIRINVMQNSAISFSFCVDFRENKVMALIEKLQHSFEVYYNTGLTLITVKNYDDQTFETYRKHAGVLLEQSSRSTLQVLIKP